MGTTDIHQLELTSLVKKPLSTPDKMRCFIVLALVAAASAIPLNWDPCVNGEFEIPEGAIEIDLKNLPADLPEGFTIVNDPSEIELPNGLTFEDLKNGDVPDDWEKIDFDGKKVGKKFTKTVRGKKTVTPTVVDCDDVVVTKSQSIKSRTSARASATAKATSNGKAWTWNKKWEPVVTSNVYKINDIVVPNFFKRVRDFKSSCDWFTTGDASDFFEAIGEGVQWIKVNNDAPKIIELGSNDFTIPQIEEMVAGAKNVARRIRNLFR